MTEYLNKNNFLCVIVKIVQASFFFFFFFSSLWRSVEEFGPFDYRPEKCIFFFVQSSRALKNIHINSSVFITIYINFLVCSHNRIKLMQFYFCLCSLIIFNSLIAI